MNWNLLKIVGIGILLVFACGFLLQSASAANESCYFVNQGDTIYWNDCVDLTGVGGWDMRIAHWNNTPGYVTGYPDDYPDIVFDISSFPRRIKIWPDVYPIGAWYKWSGKDEPGGSNLAFYIAKGREASNVTLQNVTPNATPSLYYPGWFNTSTPTLTPIVVYETVIMFKTVEVPIVVNNTVFVEVTPKTTKNNDFGYSALGVLALAVCIYAAIKVLRKK